jgi:hypothetical protein
VGLHRHRLHRLSWPLFAAGLAVFALALQAGGTAWPDPRWDWQPALAFTQPWRWWTAAGAHWSPQHLQMNLAGCALLAWLGWRAGLGPRATGLGPGLAADPAGPAAAARAGALRRPLGRAARRHRGAGCLAAAGAGA